MLQAIRLSNLILVIFNTTDDSERDDLTHSCGRNSRMRSISRVLEKLQQSAELLYLSGVFILLDFLASSLVLSFSMGKVST